ncbi:MAG: ABC transporter permease [Ignavibacteria bacterium]|nr:ABC transporter permease [Ignavibacteria bacterium]MBT8381199.1 ABC transporter permease [Ignavibacteria bacterium]MBT8390533.1 ABC transporter permease [Ignavibacteria bacterium]NNJ52843.1 ABC transporter permease [Ignavibacteriaceae bacterium]NNL21517.1 ABC transporter permease [Ignavibacteriaceae bacterium]
MEIAIKNSPEKLFIATEKQTGKAFAKRFLTSLITLFLLVSLIFVFVRLSPGDPTKKYVSAQLSPELSQKISEKFMLDKPVIEQYFAFLLNSVKGDLGVSYNFRQPVMKVVWEYFSFTLVFSTLSIFLQIIFSFSLAIFVARRKNTFLNKAVSDFSLFIYSIPSFVLGVFLIYLFSVVLNLFPISGLKSLDYDSFSFWGKILDQAWHLALPLITLSAAGTAMFYKYIKEGMDDVLHQSYILNLRSSGVKEKVILKKHVIPNAISPLISVAGIELGVLLGGALITEVIFSLPGMGRLTVNSILTRDYPLIIGCVLTAGIVMIIANYLADIIKIKFDKRLLKGLLN